MSNAKDRRPINPETKSPLPEMAQPGYYPGYSTLGQSRFWDAATREVVLGRMTDVPPIRFFTPDEAEQFRAVIDRIMPQDDRDEAHRIPILPYIDTNLVNDGMTGTRFEGMPPQPEAFRRGLQGIEAIGQFLYHKPFTELEPREQDAVLKTLHDDDPPAGQDIWHELNVERFWLMLVGSVVSVYYAHPFAWDEIGYGGPAYPRGYFRLLGGQPEPWEVAEVRYEWEAPPDSLSGDVEPIPEKGYKMVMPGQGGTH